MTSPSSTILGKPNFAKLSQSLTHLTTRRRWNCWKQDLSAVFIMKISIFTSWASITPAFHTEKNSDQEQPVSYPKTQSWNAALGLLEPTVIATLTTVFRFRLSFHCNLANSSLSQGYMCVHRLLPTAQFAEGMHWPSTPVTPPPPRDNPEQVIVMSI